MSNEKQPALIVKDLYKSFKLPHEQHSGVKQILLNIFRRDKKKGYETQQVLQDVSFEIQEGEFFGIVGRNGSGKSTLLKLLANIYVPDSGLIQVNGSLTPFIELGVGFNPELTGRENVYLNGALLGFSHKEMDAMYDDIVGFAELERFMDQKLKNYSSGMQVRLAFSIAIRAKSDILLLDEVLAVGDQTFQRKCYDYFRQLKKEGRTVILVTHDMEAVKNYCTRAMLLDKSEVVSIGRPSDVADEYSLRMVANRTVIEEGQEQPIRKIKAKSIVQGKVLKGDKLDIEISYEADPGVKYFLSYAIRRDGVLITDSSSQFQEGLVLKEGTQKVKLSIDVSQFTTGQYELDLAFYNSETSELIAYKNTAITQLIVNDEPRYGGLFTASSSWKVVE